MSIETTLHLASIITLLGAVLYAVADVLILAHHVGPRQPIPATAIVFEADSRWRRRANLLICVSKLPWKRLVWGGLLGVCMTPLVMSGSWVLYHALAPAGLWWSVPVALLWLGAYPIGAFIHGSFIYLGGVVQSWNLAEGACKAQLEETVSRMVRVLMSAYLIFFSMAAVTSILYAISVLKGSTALPRWMAALNPLIMTGVYIFVARKVIPLRIMKYVQGAGFNIEKKIR
jgi:hypothetical protein